MSREIILEALNGINDEFITETAERLGLPGGAAVISLREKREKHEKRENPFSRFLNSGWGVAVICAAISLGVLAGIIRTGQRPPAGGPGGTDTSTETNAETSAPFISEEQAVEIASDYWGIKTGDADPDTGYIFRIESMGQTQTPKGDAVYEIALRWLVEAHYSTVETVWVDVLTGEVIVPYGQPVGTETETQAHVHAYGEWQTVTEPTCAEKGKRERTCACGETESESIATLPHTEVVDPAVAPTVTETGLTEGKHCEVCGKVLLSRSVIAATGHTDLAFEINEDGKTCTITGIGTCTATDIYIPSAMEGYKVTRIREVAFMNQSQLTGVHFSSTITELGEAAFYGCTGLTEISLPSSITSLGDGVFQNCTELTKVTIESRITELPRQLFYGCTALSEVDLPSTLTEIGMIAFSNCTSLERITLPASLQGIGMGAFQGCTALTGVTLPSRLYVLDDVAFEGCVSLTEMTLPDSLVRIGSNALSGCSGITAITVPTNVKQAEPSAFERMDGLTDIYFRGTEAEWNAVGYVVGEGVQLHFGA